MLKRVNRIVRRLSLSSTIFTSGGGKQIHQSANIGNKLNIHNYFQKGLTHF